MNSFIIVYLLTSFLMLLGVAYFVMREVGKLKNKYNSLSKKEIFTEFFKAEWDSLMVSGLVLITWNAFLFICQMNEFKFHDWFDMWGMYGLALVLGYSGQRLAYKALTTVEGVLDKKIEGLKK